MDRKKAVKDMKKEKKRSVGGGSVTRSDKNSEFQSENTSVCNMTIGSMSEV